MRVLYGWKWIIRLGRLLAGVQCHGCIRQATRHGPQIQGTRHMRGQGLCVCVCVCVCARASIGAFAYALTCLCVCMYVYVCV